MIYEEDVINYSLLDPASCPIPSSRLNLNTVSGTITITQ